MSNTPSASDSDHEFDAAADDLEASLSEQEPPLAGKRIAFLGKLGGVNRREAQAIARRRGGQVVEASDADVNLVVVGADELPLGDRDQPLLDETLRERAAAGTLEIISETQFWQRLGLVEGEQNIRRLYTPAMLADLLKVSVATIRRWHRRGLIVPVREVRSLPYFDFQEVATARRLAELVAAGVSPAALERQLAELSRFVPEVERPLAQLSVIVEGRSLLLRQGEGLVEPTGQRRIDFDALEALAQEKAETGETGGRSTAVSIPFSRPVSESSPNDLPAAGAHVDMPSPQQLMRQAAEWEDEGRLDAALDAYRAALAAGGPHAETCFHLAELLYRVGDLGAARERYYMAIELDEDYVEARANLGCLLAETGQRDLAVAAFEGALRFHPDYADVHYHLARTLDDLNRGDAACHHWERFLEVAAGSPWSDEARQRLNEAERKRL